MPTIFQQKVFNLLLALPAGKVTTYQAVARGLGVRSYRAIGQALKANQKPEEIPCYRIVKNDGRVGGYYGNNPCMISLKIEKLRKEGLVIEEAEAIKDSRIINLKKYLYYP